MFNKVVLIGNLTKDMEIRYSKNGTAIIRNSIATNRHYKTDTGEKKTEVCFIDVVFYGKSAETINQYLHKGSKILVEGRLVLEKWTDQYGNKKSKHSVAVESMKMMGKSEERNSSSEYSNTDKEITKNIDKIDNKDNDTNKEEIPKEDDELVW